MAFLVIKHGKNSKMFAILRHLYVLLIPTVHSCVAMSMVLTFQEADANPIRF